MTDEDFLSEEIPKETEQERKQEASQIGELKNTIDDLKSQLEELKSSRNEYRREEYKEEKQSEFDNFARKRNLKKEEAESFKEATSAIVRDIVKDIMPDLNGRINSASRDMTQLKIEKGLDAAKRELSNDDLAEELPVEVLDAIISGELNSKNQEVVNRIGVEMAGNPKEYYLNRHAIEYARYRRDPVFKKQVDEAKDKLRSTREDLKKSAGNYSGASGTFNKRHPEMQEEEDSITKARKQMLNYLPF